MSIHRSLKVGNALVRARNVWTRAERLEKLRKDGKLEDGASVYGLPKVRTVFKQRKTVAEGDQGNAPAAQDEGAEAAEGSAES